MKEFICLKLKKPAASALDYVNGYGLLELDQETWDVCDAITQSRAKSLGLLFMMDQSVKTMDEACYEVCRRLGWRIGHTLDVRNGRHVYKPVKAIKPSQVKPGVLQSSRLLKRYYSVAVPFLRSNDDIASLLIFQQNKMAEVPVKVFDKKLKKHLPTGFACYETAALSKLPTVVISSLLRYVITLQLNQLEQSNEVVPFLGWSPAVSMQNQGLWTNLEKPIVLWEPFFTPALIYHALRNNARVLIDQRCSTNAVNLVAEADDELAVAICKERPGRIYDQIINHDECLPAEQAFRLWVSRVADPVVRSFLQACRVLPKAMRTVVAGWASADRALTFVPNRLGRRPTPISQKETYDTRAARLLIREHNGSLVDDNGKIVFPGLVIIERILKFKSKKIVVGKATCNGMAFPYSFEEKKLNSKTMLRFLSRSTGEKLAVENKDILFGDKPMVTMLEAAASISRFKTVLGARKVGWHGQSFKTKVGTIRPGRNTNAGAFDPLAMLPGPWQKTTTDHNYGVASFYSSWLGYVKPKSICSLMPMLCLNITARCFNLPALPCVILRKSFDKNIETMLSILNIPNYQGEKWKHDWLFYREHHTAKLPSQFSPFELVITSDDESVNRHCLLVDARRKDSRTVGETTVPITLVQAYIKSLAIQKQLLQVNSWLDVVEAYKIISSGMSQPTFRSLFDDSYPLIRLHIPSSCHQTSSEPYCS